MHRRDDCNQDVAKDYREYGNIRKIRHTEQIPFQEIGSRRKYHIGSVTR
jgi:hypothetical protein